MSSREAANNTNFLSLEKLVFTIKFFLKRNLAHNFLSCQIPSVSSEELTLPRHIRCELSRLRCHGYSLLLPIVQEKTEEFFLQRLRDLIYLLDCSASEPLRRAIFGNTSSIFDLRSRPCGMARLLGLQFLQAPIPRKKSGSTRAPPSSLSLT